MKTTAGPPTCRGHRPQPLDQPRVPQMDAVEIADRHGAAAERVGKIVEVAEKNHVRREIW